MSKTVANQIAAGEVVERPASCVKELVENSLDAGAKMVRVDIVEGGISFISVQDDGCGMDMEDAVLAFSRHATSKLNSEHDLFRIKTLGFRGEALASIAAVGKVTLCTRLTDSIQGVKVTVVGTEITDGPVAVGAPQGTTIEVHDLFFNMPARLKYLRTVATEQARCVEVVQRAALARPDVAFRCVTSGHTLFQSSGRGDLLEVLALLYGVGEAKQFIPFRASTQEYTIHGYLGRPTQSKSSRSNGHLFINERPIRNIGIHQAVVTGYQSRLMVNRHPVYVLAIELDPMLVDVNIHPHKMEARFSEERDLTNLVQQTVRNALNEVLMAPTFQFGNPSSSSHVNQQPLVFEAKSAGQQQAHQPFFGMSAQQSERERPYRPASNQPNLNDLKGVVQSLISTYQAPAALEQQGDRIQENRPIDWRLLPIGQALGMYVLADDGNSLYIIDQHAAHERILYEQFSKRMRQKEIYAIPLLTPIMRTLRPTEHAFVLNQLAVFQSMGLQFEAFGGYDVLVRTVPDIWEGLDADKLVAQVCECLDTGDIGKDVVDVMRETIVTRACKAAIKANWYLSVEEMEALCSALSNLEDPFHCPHGRPVFIRLTNRDLEKGFRRIV